MSYEFYASSCLRGGNDAQMFLMRKWNIGRLIVYNNCNETPNTSFTTLKAYQLDWLLLVKLLWRVFRLLVTFKLKRHCKFVSGPKMVIRKCQWHSHPWSNKEEIVLVMSIFVVLRLRLRKTKIKSATCESYE